MSSKCLIACVALLFVSCCSGFVERAVAQQWMSSSWRAAFDYWAELSEQEVQLDEVLETLDNLADNPINLNDTTSSRLLELPFLTPYHLELIRAYVAQHGVMFSLSELQQVNGFSREVRQLMAPFVCVLPVDNKVPTIDEVLSKGRSRLQVGWRRPVELAVGYSDSTYSGSPDRIYACYQYVYRNYLTLRFSADKDAGEELFAGSQPNGFDYYGFSLKVSDMGALRTAVLGDFALQFGQGLTLWSGSGRWLTTEARQWSYGRGVVQASTFCEYGAQRGLAATVELSRHVQLSLFGSRVGRDAAVVNDSTVSTLYSTGYHRTSRELDSKNSLHETLGGLHLDYRRQRLTVGFTAYALHLDHSVEPHHYLYNYHAFSGNHAAAAGVDFAWQHRALLLFGEVSMCHSRGTAVLAGVQLQPSPEALMSLTYRRYDPAYVNLYAQSTGRSSAVQNEEGVCLKGQVGLPFGVELLAQADLYRFPTLRYRIYSPSVGADYRLQLQRSLGRTARIELSASRRSAERNMSNQDSYLLTDVQRDQLRLRFYWHPWPSWSFGTCAATGQFVEGAESPERGWLAYQSVEYRKTFGNRELSLVGRAVLFSVDSYDARLYASENGFTYDFYVPAYQGRGWRGYLLVHYVFSENVSVAMKVERTAYADRLSVGSGHDEVASSVIHVLRARLIWSF